MKTLYLFIAVAVSLAALKGEEPRISPQQPTVLSELQKVSDLQRKASRLAEIDFTEPLQPTEALEVSQLLFKASQLDPERLVEGAVPLFGDIELSPQPGGLIRSGIPRIIRPGKPGLISPPGLAPRTTPNPGPPVERNPGLNGGIRGSLPDQGKPMIKDADAPLTQAERQAFLVDLPFGLKEEWEKIFQKMDELEAKQKEIERNLAVSKETDSEKEARLAKEKADNQAARERHDRLMKEAEEHQRKAEKLMEEGQPIKASVEYDKAYKLEKAARDKDDDGK